MLQPELSAPSPPSPPRDFVLSLEAGPILEGSGRFLARLLSPAQCALGESVPFDPPFGEACLERELRRIDEEISQPLSIRDVRSFQGPREMGRALFDSLFGGCLGRRLRAELEIREEVHIRLLLDPDEPGGRQLCALPWELLYDHRSSRPMFLGTSPRTPIVRHLWTAKGRGATTTAPMAPFLVFTPDPGRTRSRRPDGLDPCSERAIAAVEGGATAAVAFQFVVSECAAMAFGETFAEALSRGAPPERALLLGRRAIEAARPETWEWAAPALYVADEPLG